MSDDRQSNEHHRGAAHFGDDCKCDRAKDEEVAANCHSAGSVCLGRASFAMWTACGVLPSAVPIEVGLIAGLAVKA